MQMLQLRVPLLVLLSLLVLSESALDSFSNIIKRKHIAAQEEVEELKLASRALSQNVITLEAQIKGYEEQLGNMQQGFEVKIRAADINCEMRLTRTRQAALAEMAENERLAQQHLSNALQSSEVQVEEANARANAAEEKLVQESERLLKQIAELSKQVKDLEHTVEMSSQATCE